MTARLVARMVRLCGAGILSCGLLAPTAWADPVTLTLYNGQHEATGRAVAQAFEAKTGIKVLIRKGGGGQLANQIAEEGARSPADVIYTEEAPPLIKLSSQGLLAKVDEATLAQVDPRFSDNNGNWLGITSRVRVLAYNPKRVAESELPQHVLDVAGPEWAGKIAFVPSSGEFLGQTAAVIRLSGREAAEEWLTGLKAFGATYTNNVIAMKAVENGEIGAALINSYYWMALKKEKGELNSKLHYFADGDAGGLASVSGAAVVKASKHPQEAQQFLAFMVSEEGQKAILSKSAEYPVNKAVAADPLLKPYDQLKPPALSAAEIGLAEDALDLQREVGLN
ncbi:extracellular solute-binding protein [Pseudomonas sp. RIT-PI-AD]|uniref:extracellular solute-binding protein n=1 Tax=Pseudomonas sp. RIT-PI-AD TaxID=3035294 RepID=UPI0021D82190|nr:extracellular solute-binding protein [Pseudomonas sp. RIT-PI-AD]